MKLFVISFLFILISTPVKPGAETIEDEAKAMKECIEQEKPPMENVRQYLDDNPVDEKNTRCFIKCMTEKLGEINEHCMMQPSVIRSHAESNLTDEALDKAISYCGTCRHKTECCITAFRLATCLARNTDDDLTNDYVCPIDT